MERTNMSAARKELQKALCCYTADTLIYIDTVREFCERSPEWMLGREKEFHMMVDIKDRADSIVLKIGHVTQSENKGKAFLKYMKSKVTADSRRAELEKELAAVLKDTLGGLQKLHSFLDAVENLAVTSLHVFMEENLALHLPKGISLEQVQVVITAAREICPLLVEFKRDTSVFFLPKLQNVEVLSYQLDRYIQTTQTICEKLEKSSFSDFCLNMNDETLVDLDVDLSEDDLQRMLHHINQLDEIRMNQSFRTVFLFQEEPCSGFISEFSDRKPRMLQFLENLEENAVQLDRMNKGAKISSVAGSSVGAAGGVLSIIGLALIPVTAGASLILTMTGLGLGITSGVNSLVTTVTEVVVNHKHKEKANETFQSFMENVQCLQDCLEEVTKRETSQIDVVVGIGKLFGNVCATGKAIDGIVDAASAYILTTEELAVSAGRVALQEGKALRNVPRMAADIPDIGQAAAKAPLALSNSARAGFIGLNALFIGMDVFFICKDSISLAKGSETEDSQFIRARAALWRSEIDSWQKIHDFLCKGQLTSKENKAVLETPFYPEREMKKELQEALCCYTADTLIYIDTVREFCERSPEWMLGREKELHMMVDIKDRADSIGLKIGHVTQSENKGKAFLKYMKSKVTLLTAASRRAELEKELAAVLKDTLSGLEKLHCFLDAVENLAVTSLHVFMEENQGLHLPEGISLEQVQVVITAARKICHLLLKFKSDTSVFFLPKLQNVEVLSYQLNRYIKTTQKICEKLEKSSFSDFCLNLNDETLVDIDVDLSEDDIQRMFHHINQLDEIRLNQSFRTVFLFQEEPCSDFISEFSERKPRMLQSLEDLEENAVQLDRMNMGAKISSVAGSSVRAAGGVISIVGLALGPVTAGASLVLTMTGLGLGITSRVNSAVTTATEVGVNHKHQKKASETFQSFMEDMQCLQDCLEEVTIRKTSQIDVVVGVGIVLGKAGYDIRNLVQKVSAFKKLKTEELAVSAGRGAVQEEKALRNVPRVAADIPDIGQAEAKGPLARSNSVSVSTITFSALFLGMDVFSICKDSISLGKGSETEISQFIRARAALWRLEMDSWQKIHDFLCEGQLTSKENKAFLEMPFYPEREMKKLGETEMEIPFDEVDEK
ncbi:uncharacterized protein LOC119501444 isoform X1 [Sebastes umbrosus]|uniref:uncharacterized protein LOC119501444 isoform X1 n=1 Tax=Sebastes umbrosus TaxID=72105 RepID=UPI00189D8062|nr:uncharacterized protein LOC119501444 isoform X1 [Sebastes umbrosus]